MKARNPTWFVVGCWCAVLVTLGSLASILKWSQNTVGRMDSDEILRVGSDQGQLPGIDPKLEVTTSLTLTRTEDDRSKPSVAGRVINEHGEPVPNAKVRVGHFATDNIVGTTDAEGRFALDQDASKAEVVIVSAPGMAIELVELGNGADAGDVTVVLKPGNALRIRVLDEDGRPVQNAQVNGDEWRGTPLFVQFNTDGDGLIEWPEAPSGGAEYYISKPGHCQWFNQKLDASGVVHEITLPRVLKLAGQVRDAKTARPLDKFAVIPVLQLDQGAIVTDRRRIEEYRDGGFSLEFDRAGASHALRIEADGYRTQMTRFFRAGEPVGDVNIEIQQAAPCSGIVLAPDGSPPTNAEIFLATPTMPVDLSGRTGLGDGNFARKTGAEGRFSFPAQFEPYRVVVVADEGFADVACQANEEPGRIELQAWSRVSGTVMQAGQVAPGQSVELKPIVVHDLTVPRVNNFLMTNTADDGTFSFAYVPPGKYSAQSLVSIWRDSDLTSGEAVPLETGPGQIYDIMLGGNGTDVVGRVEAIGESNLSLNYSLNYLLHKTAGIAPPDSLSSAKFDWKNGWNETWGRTSEGVAYQKCLHHWMVKLAKDGSFRICGVPVGEYELSLQIYEPPADGCLVTPRGTRRVSFRVTEESVKQEIDLGRIEFTILPALKLGDAVPDFSFRTADGSTRRLSAFRGQWVLVEVWATWCGPCVAAIPEMVRLHDEVAGREDFILIGLSLDQDVMMAQDFVTKRKLPWLHGFLGDWSETNVPEQLSITLIPAYLLMGPDGRLQTRSTSVADVRKVIEKVLRANPRQPLP